jgi:hypothetical protein
MSTLAERLQNKQHKRQEDTCLLLDVSGSMQNMLLTGEKKIDALKIIIRDFPNVRQFSFSDDCEERPPTNAQGGTNMANAFNVVKEAGLRHCILVTDGLPDSRQNALRAATGLRIDIIYVGPLPPPQFLRDLALRAKGALSVENLSIPKQLKEKIYLLLDRTPPNDK